jgi:hypothetical protein
MGAKGSTSTHRPVPVCRWEGFLTGILAALHLS